MVDEKLEDQVWITVVATGYGDPPPRRRPRERPDTSALHEPAGEPRVSRVRERPMRPAAELDVPEFIPRR
jgi:cell division protein FtsZ